MKIQIKDIILKDIEYSTQQPQNKRSILERASVR